MTLKIYEIKYKESKYELNYYMVIAKSEPEAINKFNMHNKKKCEKNEEEPLKFTLNNRFNIKEYPIDTILEYVEELTQGLF